MKKKAKVRVDKNQRVIDLLNKQALQIKYLSDKVDYLSIALAGFSKPYALTPFTITSTSSSNFCTDGKNHQYPNPWFGINPPPCSRCGQYTNGTGFTYSTSSKAEH